MKRKKTWKETSYLASADEFLYKWSCTLFKGIENKCEWACAVSKV